MCSQGRVTFAVDLCLRYAIAKRCLVLLVFAGPHDGHAVAAGKQNVQEGGREKKGKGYKPVSAYVGSLAKAKTVPVIKPVRAGKEAESIAFVPGG
mmetsp:Transcript_26550/g.68419  ORF Transcript_26550/g.68419 Transcript_26550/m.68419 type:complete len:95 (-) Transcript_26550:182-466(-)|eukprot:1161345-Pelagomonas_calceolata.AAC.3